MRLLLLFIFGWKGLLVVTGHLREENKPAVMLRGLALKRWGQWRGSLRCEWSFQGTPPRKRSPSELTSLLRKGGNSVRDLIPALSFAAFCFPAFQLSSYVLLHLLPAPPSWETQKTFQRGINPAGDLLSSLLAQICAHPIILFSHWCYQSYRTRSCKTLTLRFSASSHPLCDAANASTDCARTGKLCTFL